MTSAECPWCTRPVARTGHTCDFQCYAAWYAWQYGRAGEQVILVGAGGRLIRLNDEDEVPVPLESQPWYEDALAGNERRERQ